MISFYLFTIALLISFILSVETYYNHSSPLFLLLWLFSIACLLFSMPILHNAKNIISLFRKNYLLLFVFLLPVLIRIATLDVTRLHTDDILSGYFSAHYDFWKINLFSGIPQMKVDWVAQFPTTYFVLQKLFFLVFGESIYSIKLSSMPYVLIISVMLYLLGKELVNKTLGVVSVIMYAFFALSIYIDTWGLHFTASTAAFTVFFYFAIKQFRAKSRNLAIATGISCAFCYLFYITSYIALPVFLFIAIIQFLKVRKFFVLKNTLITLITFLIVLGPYITYAFKFDNYFFSRINQVSLLTGSWSSAPSEISKGKDPFIILKENAIDSFQSLGKFGIGGHGGYTFAHLALFEKYHLYLFLLGVCISLVFIWKKIEFLFVYAALILSFITMVLATPPPAYQRILVAVPFICLLSGLPFACVSYLRRIDTRVRLASVFLILLPYVILNLRYFNVSVQDESDNINLRVIRYINTNFPGRHMYVAAFPGFIFEKIYYFAPGKNAETITTGYHEDLLKSFTPSEKYVYVIFFADVFNERFREIDPKGKFVNFYRENNLFYSLFVN